MNIYLSQLVACSVRRLIGDGDVDKQGIWCHYYLALYAFGPASTLPYLFPFPNRLVLNACISRAAVVKPYRILTASLHLGSEYFGVVDRDRRRLYASISDDSGHDITLKVFSRRVNIYRLIYRREYRAPTLPCHRAIMR